MLYSLEGVGEGEQRVLWNIRTWERGEINRDGNHAEDPEDARRNSSKRRRQRGMMSSSDLHRPFWSSSSKRSLSSQDNGRMYITNNNNNNSVYIYIYVQVAAWGGVVMEWWRVNIYSDFTRGGIWGDTIALRLGLVCGERDINGWWRMSGYGNGTSIVVAYLIERWNALNKLLC